MAGYDINELKRRMQGALGVLKTELNGLRTGRASAHLLDPVHVDAYGQSMALNQLATNGVTLASGPLGEIQTLCGSAPAGTCTNTTASSFTAPMMDAILTLINYSGTGGVGIGSCNSSILACGC